MNFSLFDHLIATDEVDFSKMEKIMTDCKTIANLPSQNKKQLEKSPISNTRQFKYSSEDRFIIRNLLKLKEKPSQVFEDIRVMFSRLHAKSTFRNYLLRKSTQTKAIKNIDKHKPKDVMRDLKTQTNTKDLPNSPHGHYRTTQTNWNHVSTYIKFRYECALKEIPSEGKVYELGCGIGVGLNYLAKNYPNVNFIGLDISEEAIEFGKSNFSLPNLHLSHINSANNLSKILDKNSILIALEVLEHLNDEQIQHFKNRTMKRISKAIFSFPYNQQNIEGTDHLQSFNIYDIFEIFPGFETLFLRRGSIKFIGKWERKDRLYIKEKLGIAGEDKSIERVVNAEPH